MRTLKGRCDVAEALRVRTLTQPTMNAGGGGFFPREGPDIDIVGSQIGRGGDTILVFHSDGSPVDEYPATAAGLTAALTAVVEYDTVELPQCQITGDFTIATAHVAIRGKNTALEGYPLINGTITVTALQVALHNLWVVDDVGSSPRIAVDVETGGGAYCRRCTLEASGAAVNAGAYCNGTELVIVDCTVQGVNWAVNCATGNTWIGLSDLISAGGGAYDGTVKCYPDGTCGVYRTLLWNSGAGPHLVNQSSGDLIVCEVQPHVENDVPTALRTYGTITYAISDRACYYPEEYHAADIEAAALTRHLPLPGTAGHVARDDGSNWVSAALDFDDLAGDCDLADLASYAQGSIIRGGAADWEAYDAKTLGAALVGDGTDIGSTITPTWQGRHTWAAGEVYLDQVVDQETDSLVYAAQTAATLQDGSAHTGVDEAFDNTWEAIKFTADGNHNMRSFGVRLKVSAALTNPTGVIYGYLYTDVAGEPGALISGMQYVRYGTLTTSYVEYQFAASATLVSSTSYWLVLKQSPAPAGGTISIDRGATGVATHAHSADGAAWTTEDDKTGWHKIYGRTSYGVYGSSTNSIGVYGISANFVGVRGISTSSYGVYGSSTNSIGVYGISANFIGVYGSSTNFIGVYGFSTNSYGVYGSSTNSIGVYGSSTNSIGVYGSSTNSNGVRGVSTTNRSGYFYRNSDTATTANFEIITDHAGDTQTVLRVQGDGSGDLINVFDGANEVLTLLDGGDFGLGCEPDRRLHAEVADAVTNAVTYAQRLSHVSSGAVIAGFGTGIEFELEENNGTNKVAAALDAVWADAGETTNADADIILKLMLNDAAAAEKARLTSAGDWKIPGDYYSGGSQGLSGTLTLDDGANWRITLAFTGGILTGQTTGASVGATAAWA